MYITATNILIAINIIVYILTQSNLTSGFGLNSLAISQNQYYRFITCMFIHGSVMHLFMNMSGLYGLGSMLEGRIGAAKLVFLYILIGVLAGFGSLTIRMASGHDNIVSIGASGAIYGLFGLLMGIVWRNAGLQSAFMASKQTLLFLVLMCFMKGIDNTAHIFGFLLGLFTGFLFL